MINRAGKVEDTWLTPPELLAALGKFDMDVCCPSGMPWKTAPKMVCLPEDGLAVKWKGRVWCNPPFSHILPWAEKMANHGNGILLVPAKSPCTVWGQLVLASSDAVLFQKGRLSFHYLDGSKPTGKWGPYMLCAYGPKNVEVLKQAAKGFVTPGILMGRI
jgi:hypothetical protein